MSRIGKLPVAIPQGVKVNVSADTVQIEGPKGKLQRSIARGVKLSTEDGKVVVAIEGSDRDLQLKADYGTMRSHINNMMEGVTKGWKKSLEMTGVGYTATVKGKELVLTVGFSHDVKLDIPAVVKCNVNKTTIELESHDLESLSLFAAKIRKTRPPEPYLGKGIAYAGEKIRRKAGKTGK